MSKRALGKGIDALFGDMNYPAEPQENMVIEIPLAQIDPNREQPRKRFDQEALQQLADSMQSVGVIQPITVYAEDGGRYVIIAGERRWRAARLAGLKTIPAMVRDLDRIRRMEVALIENLQRTDLNPVEEALGIRHLMEECGLTQEQASKRLGRSRSAIANLLRLLSLPEAIQDLLRQGQLTEGHARAIAGLPEGAMQEELAQEVIERGMTVRQTEEAVRRLLEPAQERKRPERVVSEGMSVVEEAARRAFGTKVKVEGSEERGKLVIQYFNRDDLDRIYSQLMTMEQ